MFKAVLSDSNILKSSFDAISSIVDEVQIQADEEGLRLNAMDRSHITFVHLELKKGLFSEYQCEELTKINVDTDELMKVLRRAKSDDMVELTVDEGNLILIFEGEAKRKFQVRLIDMEEEDNNPPQLEYPTEFEVPFALLKDSIQDISIVSQKIVLHVNEDKFTASAEGDFGDAYVEYLHGEKIEKDAKSVFSIEKVKEMLKADKFSESAVIRMGNDMPLNLALKMASGDGELSFLLAPRLEKEE